MKWTAILKYKWQSWIFVILANSMVRNNIKHTSVLEEKLQKFDLNSLLLAWSISIVPGDSSQ